MRINRIRRSSVAAGTILVAVSVLLMSSGQAFAQAAPASGQLPQQPPATVGAGSGVAAAQDAEALAKQLSNPVASLISVPFQFNWDHSLGPENEGRRFLLNLQPVLPFKMNEDWNLITRIIVPTIAQPVLVEGGQPSFGMGDILVSLFFSPSKGAIVWGVGPALGLPVTSDTTIGTGKYVLGPTAVVLKQTGPWTYGALVNQVWSIGGDSGRSDVNQTFLQPFLAHARKGWTVSLNTETSANWEAGEGQKWTVPFNVSLSKVVRLGTHPLSLGGGPRFYAESPDGGPSWGFRFSMTLLFPAGS